MSRHNYEIVQMISVCIEVISGILLGPSIGYGVFDATEYGGSVWSHIQTPVIALVIIMVVCTAGIIFIPIKKK